MSGYQDQLAELFEPVGGVSLRRMFGGIGVFRNGLMFGLVIGDVLFFKADDTTSPAFEAEGYQRWVYDGHKRPVEMPYWQAPERLFDEPDAFTEWALAAYAAAERKKVAKGAKPKAKSGKAGDPVEPPATKARKVANA